MGINFGNLEKQITFYTPDTPAQPVCKSAFYPIADEANSRGYTVNFTQNCEENSEIGFYNDHRSQIPCLNSKLSLVTFHGIDDAYYRTFWLKEPWWDFDIGLLLGEASKLNWYNQSWYPKANPQLGMVTVGWPKSDYVYTKEHDNNVSNLMDSYDINSRSILLASTQPTLKQIKDIHTIGGEYFDYICIKSHPTRKIECNDYIDSKDNLKLINRAMFNRSKSRVLSP